MRCFVNDRTNDVQDDLLDEQIKMAYGFSDQQLEQEMDYAMAHPDYSPQLKAPDDEFQRIMEKVAQRIEQASGSSADPNSFHSSDNPSDSSDLPPSNPIPIHQPPDHSPNSTPPRRPNRRKIMKVAVIAAVLGVLGIGEVMNTVGRSGYKYGDFRSDGGDNVVVWNNVAVSVEGVSSEDEAYSEIQEELAIPVLKLRYVPVGMTFDELLLENQRATLKFNYNGYIIRLVEVGDPSESFNAHVSDRKKYDERFNRFLNENVILSKNELDGGLTEYSAEITTDIAYYYLSGIMSEAEFNKIVDRFYFMR